MAICLNIVAVGKDGHVPFETFAQKLFLVILKCYALNIGIAHR